MVQTNSKPIGEKDENTRCDVAGDCDRTGGAVAGTHLSSGGFDIVDNPGSLIAAMSQAVRS